MELTEEQWERIKPLCSQIAHANGDDYGYIHANSLKIEDIMCDTDPEYFLGDTPRIFNKDERSRLFGSAAEKDITAEGLAHFLATFQEVKAATIKRLEKVLGRSISNL
ncbi:MAG: hypothetical protein IPN44_02115 [Flavobacteriales bacterium]|nr:hypothetical protein [Flavobacteriales bacterium]